MTLMPEVHDALALAVSARGERRRSWRPSRRVGLLAVGAVIATGSAVAATGGWHPVLGDDHRGHPQVAHAAIPGDQTAAIAVLRRAQTDADRTPDVRAVLRMLGRGEINGVHTDGIRLLRTRRDGVTVLVPTERVGRHDMGHPSSIRRDVLCVMTSVRVASRAPTVVGRDGRSRTVRTAGGGTGQSCGDIDELRTTGIGGAMASGHGFFVNRLVPDGVARVVIRLRRHRTITVPVHDNLYEVNTGDELPPGWGVRWLDANGKKIEHRRDKP
jgi:hypothetical protein